MKEIAITMINMVYGSALNQNIATIFDPMGWLIDYGDFIEGVYNIIAILGLYILIYNFLMDVMNKVSVDHGTQEAFIKSLIKLFVSMMIVQNGYTIFSTIITVGGLLLNAINNALANGLYGELVEGVSTLGTATASKDFGLIGNIGAVTALFMPFVATIIIMGMILLSICSIPVEMCVLMIFAPIPLGDCYNGMSSSAMKYLRRFISLILQMSVIIIVIACYPILVDFMKDGLGLIGFGWISSAADMKLDTLSWVANPVNWLSFVIVKVALLGAIKKSGQLADAICA